MLENLYKNLDKIINDESTEVSLPSVPLETEQVPILEEVKNGTYSIDESNRTILIDNKQLFVPFFFNFENFLKNDIKTVDYIFTYFGYDYQDYKRV